MLYDIVIRVIADGFVVPIVLIGAYMLLFKIKSKSRVASYSRVLMAGLTAYLIAKLSAFVYQPETLRPFETLGTNAGALYLNNPGFPSDHALFVTAIVLAVWFETKNKPVTIALTVMALLVCFGRVLALVHTPVDVIFGIIFALIGGLWYINSKDENRRTAKAKS